MPSVTAPLPGDIACPAFGRGKGSSGISASLALRAHKLILDGSRVRCLPQS